MPQRASQTHSPFFLGVMDFWQESVDEDHIRREKAKAKDLRQSQWWKNRRGEGKCYYCGERVPVKSLTMDHVVPISRGGSTTKSNVVPCCKTCNNQKKNLLPQEWEQYLQQLEREAARR